MLIIDIVLFVILVYLSRHQIRRMEPAGVFALFWLFLIGASVLFSHYLMLSYFGIAYILIALIAFSVGSSLAPLKASSHPKTVSIFNDRRAFIIVCAVTIAGFIKPMYDLFSQGFNVFLMRGMEDVLAMNNEMSEQRYAETVETSVATQLLGVFYCAAPMLAGFCLPHFRGWKRAFCFFSIVPCVFGALTQGAKMGLLMSSFSLATGYFVSCQSMGKRISLSGKSLLKVGLAGLALFALLLTSMVFRSGKIDDDTIAAILEKFVSYALGSVPCFDYWFVNAPVSIDSHSFGAKTFWGVSNFLGILNRESGIYQEMIFFGKNGLDARSNVFSVFRVLIEDFGYIVPILLALIGGYGTKRVYMALPIQRKGRCAYQVVLMAFYIYIFWSFVTSYFAYTTYLVTLGFVWVMLYIIQSPRKKRIVIV